LKKEYECKKLYLKVKSNNMNSFQLYKEYSMIEPLYNEYPKSDDFIRYFTKSKINQIEDYLRKFEEQIKKEQIKNNLYF